MIRKKAEIVNEAGLHARPASALVKLSSKFDSEFYIYRQGYRINGKSILGVMTLAAEQGTELELEFEGPDEQQAAEAVLDLINRGFDED